MTPNQDHEISQSLLAGKGINFLMVAMKFPPHFGSAAIQASCLAAELIRSGPVYYETGRGSFEISTRLYASVASNARVGSSQDIISLWVD